MNITYRHFKVERDFFFGLLPVGGTVLYFFVFVFFKSMFSGDKRRTDLSDFSDTKRFSHSAFFCLEEKRKKKKKRAQPDAREQVRERSRVTERPGASLDLCRVAAFVCILYKKKKKKTQLSTSSRTLSDFFWFQVITWETPKNECCCCSADICQFTGPEVTSCSSAFLHFKIIIFGRLSLFFFFNLFFINGTPVCSCKAFDTARSRRVYLLWWSNCHI